VRYHARHYLQSVAGFPFNAFCPILRDDAWPPALQVTPRASNEFNGPIFMAQVYHPRRERERRAMPPRSLRDNADGCVREERDDAETLSLCIRELLIGEKGVMEMSNRDVRGDASVISKITISRFFNVNRRCRCTVIHLNTDLRLNVDVEFLKHVGASAQLTYYVRDFSLP